MQEMVFTQMNNKKKQQFKTTLYVISSIIIVILAVYYFHNMRIDNYIKLIDKDLKASNKIAFLELKKLISRKNILHLLFLLKNILLIVTNFKS